MSDHIDCSHTSHPFQTNNTQYTDYISQFAVLGPVVPPHSVVHNTHLVV